MRRRDLARPRNRRPPRAGARPAATTAGARQDARRRRPIPGSPTTRRRTESRRSTAAAARRARGHRRRAAPRGHRQGQAGQARRRARPSGLRSRRRPSLSRASSKSAMTIGLQYDDAKLYVGADIKDASFAVGRDHVSLVLAVPVPSGTYATYDLGLYAGKPGESEGSVRYGGRAPSQGRRSSRPRRRAATRSRPSFPGARCPKRRATRVGIHGVGSLRGRRGRDRDRAREPAAPVGDGLGSERAGAVDDRAVPGAQGPDEDLRRRSRPSPTSPATGCASASPSSSTT